MVSKQQIGRESGGRHGANSRLALLGALLFLLSALTHLVLAPAQAAEESGWRCHSATAGEPVTDAAPAEEKPSLGGHCADCPMAATPIHVNKIELAVAHIVFTPRQPVLPPQSNPREQIRAGEKRSRAPPVFS